MSKLYFEDIETGRRLVSPWYAVSRDEIVQFARAWDPYDFHLDEEAAAKSIFGGLAACTAHMFAILSRLAHDLPDTLALVAGLGGDGLQILAPLRPGASVRLIRCFTKVRPSKSRPHAGILTMTDTLELSSGEAVFQTSGSVLVARRQPESPGSMHDHPSAAADDAGECVAARSVATPGPRSAKRAKGRATGI